MIKPPYPAQIYIDLRDGKALIDAVIVGNLAVHLTNEYDATYPYKVSHTKTGLAIPFEFPSEEAAICFAYRVNALFKNVPECDLDNPEYVTWVARVKGALNDAAQAEGGIPLTSPIKYVRKGGRWIPKLCAAASADENGGGE